MLVQRDASFKCHVTPFCKSGDATSVEIDYDTRSKCVERRTGDHRKILNAILPTSNWNRPPRRSKCSERVRRFGTCTERKRTFLS